MEKHEKYQAKMIVAMDPDRVIAVNGKIPWYYKADLRRFKERTMGGTLIVGFKTCMTLPETGLPGRQVLALSRDTSRQGTYSNLDRAFEDALRLADPIWVIGGAEVYAQSFSYVAEIDLTLVPEVEVLEGAQVVRFPEIPSEFELVEQRLNIEDQNLTHRLYKRIKS